MSLKTNKEIDILIRARYPLIYVVSWEEQRVEKALEDIASSRNKGLYIWTSTSGLESPSTGGRFPEGLRKPVNMLDHIIKSRETAIFVLKDFHQYIKEPVIIRKLKDVAQAIKQSRNTLIILSSELEIPNELEKHIAVVDYPLPDYDDLKTLLHKLIEVVRKRVRIDLPPETEEKIIKAALGLTLSEAENVFSRAVVMNNHLGEEDIDVILMEKEQIIRKSGLLEYYHAQEKFSQVGGLDHLKNWLMNRGQGFTEKAREYGLPQPKGILLLGLPGCGKSLCAKVISSLWNLPLLRLDMGSIFSSFIGSSEANIRKAIKMSESLSPCILWTDEIEKGMSGIQSSGSSDGGTSSRIFGTLLSWMQEKTAPVFIVATANNISKLPPEMLRKGRFDEIFFVDLPNSIERKQIFEIHISMRQRKVEEYDLDSLVRASEGFSGAEIEQAVLSAMFVAFSENREFNTEDVLNALKVTYPLSKTMSDDITGMRLWAKNRARKASYSEEEALGEKPLSHRPVSSYDEDTVIDLDTGKFTKSKDDTLLDVPLPDVSVKKEEPEKKKSIFNLGFLKD